MIRVGSLASGIALSLGLAGLTGIGVPSTGAQPVAGEQPAEAALSAASSGIAKFGSCMSGKRTADVVLLLDESGSLATSDPNGARVDAAQYLVKQWSALSIETSVKIAIQTMGFSENVQDASGKWLDAGKDYPQLKADLEAFRARNTGAQTDYWMALDGARKALAERAQKGGSTCQAILWFSDGKLDAFSTYTAVIDGKQQSVTKPYLDSKSTDNAAATAAASKDLCRKGGVADQVRSSDVATFAVGLAAGTATRADFDLMEAIALGKNGCGAVSASGTGDFHLATDIDELILAFDAVRTPGQLPIEQRLGVCQGQICPAHSHRFVLDDSITRVHITASATVPGLKLFVVPPTGKAVELPREQETKTRVGAATVTSDGLSQRTTSLDFASAGTWTGVWSVVFVDPDKASGNAKSITNLELSADVEPAITLPDKIYAGEKSAPVKIGLQHHDGSVINPADLLGTFAMSLDFTDSAGKRLPVAAGLDAAALREPLTLDLTNAADGKGTLTATVALTTAPVKPAKGSRIPGTKLSPESADFDVAVLPPVNFPIVADAVNFGTSTGAAKAAAALKVTGPGCVWIDAPAVTASPERAGEIGVTSSANSSSNCLRLAQGESGTLPITFTSTAAANGAVTGTVTAHLAPEGELDRARTKPVAFTANLDKAPNTTKKLFAFFVALALGIGIPVALMYLVKRLNSKIPPLPLIPGVFDIALEGGQVVRDGMPFAVQPHELRDPIPIPAGGASRLTIGPAELRVSNGWSPFGPGQVLASVAGAAGISATRTTPRKDGAAELPLAIHNNWALFNAPERGPGHGRLLLLVGGDASPDKKQGLISEALGQVPQRLLELAGAASTAASTGLTDPGGGEQPGPRLTDPDAAWTHSPTATRDPWEEAGVFGSAPSGAAETRQSPEPAGAGDPWSFAEPSPGTETDNPWAAPTVSSSGQSDPWAPTGPVPPSPQTDPWSSQPASAPAGTGAAFAHPDDVTMPRAGSSVEDPDQWQTQPRPKPEGEPPVAAPEANRTPPPPSFDFSALDNPDQAR
ncbi:MAG: VWA domain-containing protein [Tetrasphaera sp.]